jgi:flagellar basal-body rod protein FlgB
LRAGSIFAATNPLHSENKFLIYQSDTRMLVFGTWVAIHQQTESLRQFFRDMNMSISFEAALGIHEKALRFRGERASVLADNLANADTPGYKAKDLDFKTALQSASKTYDRFSMQKTHVGHQYAVGFSEEGDEFYRVPQQSSLDGNTVEDQIEHAEYMKNTLAFQASFQFLNSKFNGLRTAIRGD